ncbi:class I SAM-dependent methyltransferase [Tengunoibacter tsumagoiensis]|uniref:Methyltransferase domain-containing protein n=1 Tax=Tengunoibacter tsumagoiensis TaxID=2014871 RepID=A0A401ZVF0_9CHLR|nr:class I SAM-dependent methyltransferase [Tengunoibacter tsumagoiensis]GCE10720.1 hypothetical protein KTT_05790 [Tengunoibacter tsumagoiensis]
MPEHISAEALEEMKNYYRARAHEYDEWFYRQGRYDRGAEANARWFAEVEQVFTQLAELHLTGDILELAPGTGIWTEHLLKTATTITAVDASSEMIELNRAKIADPRISYIQNDLFTWQPERTYAAVVFGFWISHVPLERLDAFLLSVRGMLDPGGKIFFVDGRREITSTAINHQLPLPDNQVMTRILNDGSAFQIIKNFYDPTELTHRFQRLGFDMTVRETEKYFLYGYGSLL